MNSNIELNYDHNIERRTSKATQNSNNQSIFKYDYSNINLNTLGNNNNYNNINNANNNLNNYNPNNNENDNNIITKKTVLKQIDLNNERLSKTPNRILQINSRNSNLNSNHTHNSNKIIQNRLINGKIVIEGVCSNCINLELMKLHNLGIRDNTSGDDPFTIQARRKNELQQRIQFKVDRNFNLSQKAAENTVKMDEKTKLINENQKADFPLFKSSNDPLKQRTLERYKKNEECLLKRRFNGYNKNVEDFYNKPNPITNGSVDAIGRNKLRNKYLPTISQYKKFLDQQILNRENRKKMEKDKDKENEAYIFQKNLKEAEIENNARNNYLKGLKRDFINQNKKLIEDKDNEKKRNKSFDIATEQQALQKIKDEDNQINKEKLKKKFRVRKELISELSNQIKLKNQKPMDYEPLGKANNFNICCEPENIDEFGRCIKCLRIMKKNQIHPKMEYERIKDEEKLKMGN